MSKSAREIQDQRDWTDETLLELCLQYIENQDSEEAFVDFLQQAAADEEEYDEDEDTEEDE